MICHAGRPRVSEWTSPTPPPGPKPSRVPLSKLAGCRLEQQVVRGAKSKAEQLYFRSALVTPTTSPGSWSRAVAFSAVLGRPSVCGPTTLARTSTLCMLVPLASQDTEVLCEPSFRAGVPPSGNHGTLRGLPLSFQGAAQRPAAADRDRDFDFRRQYTCVKEHRERHLRATSLGSTPYSLHSVVNELTLSATPTVELRSLACIAMRSRIPRGLESQPRPLRGLLP
ncbi:hypothetical protein OH76DRAFT_817880 [Lentinus brumalis]|uniref:Uncharacterized protein n=1 Tax=Lentinus brumalis TaxID=2498619 RepID=A0A371D2J9_9APHY|nr:hypothetical protein OH76DRAFT_817880 [Polyporus brumalis]